MIRLKKYTFVSFDALGTLINVKPVGKIYSNVGKRYGINADPGLLDSCFKKSFSFMSEHHANFGLRSGLGWRNWWKKVVVMTFQCALSTGNISVQSRDLDNMSLDMIDLFNSKECWTLADGSVEFLRHLQKSNIILGVISNFDPRLTNILREMCVDDYFSFIATSYECECMKPDVEIFRIAEELFKKRSCIEYCRSGTLHIGDSVYYDYLGAIKAGWGAALISNCMQDISNDCVDGNFVFKNINDLRKHLF